MTRKTITKAETRTIRLLDAVNFTQELKTHGRATITPKINKLREFAEFFFVFKLKGEEAVNQRVPISRALAPTRK